MPFGSNEVCFVRHDHKCGKYFGASKSCFIASPSEDELTPTLDLISEKLARAGFEAYVAVRERAYGQDIFCTKICGRIIETKFCLVILDDFSVEGTAIPNPNVYYEYGLMTALGKHVIPLQKQGFELAFNIQSHDTIKYTPATLGQELDRAIRDAISMTSGTEQDSHERPSERTLLRNFEMAGFVEKGDNWFLHEAMQDTQFKGFGHSEKGFYCFVAKLDKDDDPTLLLEDLNVLLFRVERKEKALVTEEVKLSEQIKEQSNLDLRQQGYEFRTGKLENRHQEVDHWIELITRVYVGIILDPEVEIPDLRSKCESLVAQYGRYVLAVSADSSIEIDDVVVSLGPLGL